MKALIIAYIVALLLAAYGWALNVIALIHSDFTHITGLLVARVIGVFMAPLGVVLGWCF